MTAPTKTRAERIGDAVGIYLAAIVSATAVAAVIAVAAIVLRYLWRLANG